MAKVKLWRREHPGGGVSSLLIRPGGVILSVNEGQGPVNFAVARTRTPRSCWHLYVYVALFGREFRRSIVLERR